MAVTGVRLGTLSASIVDVIIPVSPNHRDIVYEAVASAQAQTVPCSVFVVNDTHRRGAAWARNEGIRQGHAPFVVFLDADDLLMPTFLERTLATYRQNTYVYTDWLTYDDQVRTVRECADVVNSHMPHIITTLLPRSVVEYVGGFDESLSALEDEDLYAKVQLAGVCGVHYPEPLVHYRRQFGTSDVNSVQHGEAHRLATLDKLNPIFEQRYRKYKGKTMCACGSKETKAQPSNEPGEGKVLARPLYTQQRQPSPSGKPAYPRAGIGDTLYVYKEDVELRPDLWEPVQLVVTPDVDTVRNMVLSL